MLDTLTLGLLLGLFLSGWLIPVLQVPQVGPSRLFHRAPSLPGSFGVCFALQGELRAAWHARLISLILLWVWLCPAAPYINSNRRTAQESGIPSPHLFLITVAEFSMSKQLWTVSASSPCSCPGGTSLPSSAEPCWEK